MTMTPRDLFGVAVRVGALVCWLFGLFAVVHVITQLLDIPLPSTYGKMTDVVVGAIWFLIGLLILRSADWLTRVAYGRRTA